MYSLIDSLTITYHSFLPDDAHAVLDAGEPVRDLGEIILSHGSLLDGEGTVVRCHNVEGVAVVGEPRAAAEEGDYLQSFIT